MKWIFLIQFSRTAVPEMTTAITKIAYVAFTILGYCVLDKFFLREM